MRATSHATNRPCRRDRGVSSVLAMMFMVIFASLAAAMAIVSQGNLSTASAHLKINRAHAAAETGLSFVGRELRDVGSDVRTSEGEIGPALAKELWDEQIAPLLVERLNAHEHFAEAGGGAHVEQGVVHVDAIRLASPSLSSDNVPTFRATVRQYEAEGDRDARWLEVRVVASDGRGDQAIYRSVAQDFRIDKRIPYAIFSRSRLMLGQNVMVEGPIGSRFDETHLEHGHPIHMLSNFRELGGNKGDALDDTLDWFLHHLKKMDAHGRARDNRLNLNDPRVMENLLEDLSESDIHALDVTNTGYIDEYDLFLHVFGDSDHRVSKQSFIDTADSADAARREELFDLLHESFEGSYRPSSADGFLTPDDRYAKVRGQVHISASLEDWEDGAADGSYRDYFQGSIDPDYGRSPLTFQDESNDAYDFEPSDFNVSSFRDRTSSTLMDQALAQGVPYSDASEGQPSYDLEGVREEVPYGAEHPYEYYDRPVFRNMRFENVRIPKGSNALFINCEFVGVTFVETNTDNTDPDFNYAGIQEADGTPRHPDRSVVIDGQEVYDTRSHANNLRFESSKFDGAVVSDAPQAYTHVRNKMQFTGDTHFVDLSDSTQSELGDAERALYRRSTLLAPHYSIEMGTFADPSASEQVNLSGTIVAGLIDMRGNVRVEGTVLSTFHPTSGEGPVIGETSPWFNMAIGYFDRGFGDMEAALPEFGRGSIHIRYDPTTALPDGIDGPIEIRPVSRSYREGGK